MILSVYIAASVDGFIAREDGRLDWLPASGEPDGEDYGYKAFMDAIDVIVMGRATFETVLSFGAWPYGSRKVVVLSTHAVEIPEPLRGTVEQMSGTPDDIVGKLGMRDATNVYVDGGRTIQAFLAAGHIQRLIITRIPVLLGSGIPLFGRVPQDIPLRHVATRTFPDGLVQTEYAV